MAVDGKPPVTQLRSLDLRTVGARIDAIRERLGKLDAEVNRLGSVADASSVASQVTALTRMVLYRVQAGADRHPESLDAWPAKR